MEAQHAEQVAKKASERLEKTLTGLGYEVTRGSATELAEAGGPRRHAGIWTA